LHEQPANVVKVSEATYKRRGYSVWECVGDHGEAARQNSRRSERLNNPKNKA